MKKYRYLLLSVGFVALVFAPCGSVSAAEICTIDQKESACSDAVRRAVAERFGLDPDDVESAPAARDEREEPDTAALVERVDDAARQQAVEAFRRLLDKNTGIDSPGLPSAVLDLLSRLGIDFDAGGVGDNDGNLVFELNRFLGLPVDDGYQVRVTLQNAELYEPLVAEIPEATRAERKEALEKQLDDLDNAAFTFVYSPMTERLGRSPEIHAPYFSALFESIKDTDRIEALSTRYDELSDEQGLLLGGFADRELQNRIDWETDPAEREKLEDLKERLDKFDYSFSEIAAIDADLAAELLDATEKMESVWYIRNVIFVELLEATQFFRFADLIDNQPQLHVSFEGTARDELVGPDEIKAKVTYEHGFVNVNKLREYTKRCRDTDPRANDPGERRDVLICYRQYLTPEKLAQLKRGDRFSVSLEYSDVEDYAVTLDDGLALAVAGDRKILGSLVYGRYLDFTEQGRGQSRVDVSWTHEDVGDDPNRKDRSILTLTYSQRVAGDVILAAGVAWANEPEFRGDVDHEISARVGLTYKLFKDGKF